MIYSVDMKLAIYVITILFLFIGLIACSAGALACLSFLVPLGLVIVCQIIKPAKNGLYCVLRYASKLKQKLPAVEHCLIVFCQCVNFLTSISSRVIRLIPVSNSCRQNSVA